MQLYKNVLYLHMSVLYLPRNYLYYLGVFVVLTTYLQLPYSLTTLCKVIGEEDRFPPDAMYKRDYVAVVVVFAY